jgi:hypothetical protein
MPENEHTDDFRDVIPASGSILIAKRARPTGNNLEDADAGAVLASIKR